MKLDGVTVELRPRRPWEAAELGFRMVRRDARAVYSAWFAVTLPAILLCALAMWFLPYGFLAPVLYWWLEPIADGPILGIIARRLFGGEADVRGELRNLPRTAWRNRAFWLTPLRLHFARSTAMPVTQLENLTGKARRRRAEALNPHIRNYGIGATAAYQHLSLSLNIGLMLIGTLLVPAASGNAGVLEWLEFVWTDDGKASAIVSLFIFYAAQSVLEPWYVGAGFGLYVNCRTHLEAWDVEVAFRRMVARRAAVATSLAPVAGLLVLTAIVPAADAQVEAADFGSYWTEDEAAELAGQVAARDEMSMTRTVTDWRRRDPVDKPDEEPSDLAALDAIIDSLIAVGSFVVEFGLWIAVGLLALVVFLARDRWLPYLAISGPPERRLRSIVIDGESISGATLPADVPAEVLRLWKKGSRRAALGLLYRASVFAAVDRHGVLLPDSATEGQCLDAVRGQTDPPHAGYFAAVASAWTRCAYGGSAPPDSTVESLCESWSTHYGAPA